MENIKKLSPVVFKARPVKTEVRDNQTVVLEYVGEEPGPYLTDLSHKTRWDVQDSDLDAIKPWEIAIPETPGLSVLEKGFLINRMNRTQASVWHLAGEKPDDPDGSAYTETTDATMFAALTGRETFAIAEKLTSLDFAVPDKKAPFLLQGPIAHVPCQIVTLAQNGEHCGLLFTCSRGYAQSMVGAILEAGEEFGLRPAGETAFSKFLTQ
ncbi:sarcosine oxidase subunit gamma SoxG [Desulfococcaceae bacterium HSG7]|nr:sarcosine oxidase subunit gamma SoxG [Desulfococcaceae bacterium HSG7]